MTQTASLRRRIAVAAATMLTPLAATLPVGAAAQQAVYPIVVDNAQDPLLSNLAIPANAASAGMWSRSVDWPIIAIHSSVLPDGRVLTFGAPPGGNVQDGRRLVFWNPSLGFNGNAFQIVANAQNVDSFCATATLLSDGTLLTSGGASYSSGFSSRESMRLDWKTSNAQRDYDLTAPRWYGTMTKLPDGRAIVTGGGAPYANADPNRPDAAADVSSTPEIYTPGQGWRSMVGAYSTDAFGAKNARWWYPRQWVSPNGTLFGISTEKMWEMRLDGNGAIRTLGDFKSAPNPTARVNVGPTSTAVMYDTGKILQVGGNGYHNGYDSQSSANATVIDIDNLSGGVRLTEARPMNTARQWANAVVLPNGRVLVVGGSRRADTAGDNAVFTTETWNPADGTWTVGASGSQYRGYHSTSTLLPNGAVLVAGGGAPGPAANLNAEVYYPAYLFARSGSGSVLAKRPRIVSLSTNAANHGQAIDVQLGSGDDVAEVSLIAVASVTHSFDSNQRRMKPAFTRTANGVRVTMPGSGNIAPPGYYELSVVNGAGVPSVAAIVAIGAAAPPASPSSTPIPAPSTGGQVGQTGQQIGQDTRTIAAAADGTLATANTRNELWVSQMGTNWTRMPWNWTDGAAIAANRYYAIGLDRGVYRWTGQTWAKVGRDSKAVAAGSDGTVAVINADDNTVWVKVADDNVENWRQVPGAWAKQIAVMKRGTLYFVGTDNNVWRSTMTSPPVRVGRDATAISAAADGTVTVVSMDGSLWRKNADDNNEAWTALGGPKSVKIATPDRGRLVYSDAGGLLYRR